jgi:dGTPase
VINSFYCDFDAEIIGKPPTPDIRGPFQHDRDRIIHTSAFRRLQAKTQVFRSGEYDFYRTRLTHSMEVAQIGRGICYHLLKTSPIIKEDFFIDSDLVEACCLAHDIGHPPFGHAGETTLNRLMREYGGFEGNAQTLKLISETIFSEDGRRTGMSPTRSFLDGIMKYKSLYRDCGPNPQNHFLYDEQEKYLDVVSGGGRSRDARVEQSIECQIMDWADDAAYSMGDLNDGIRARFINVDSVRQWAANSSLDTEDSKSVDGLLAAMKSRTASRFVATKIGEFVKTCGLKERSTNMDGITNRYHYMLTKEPAMNKQRELFKKLAFETVFKTPQVHQLEYKGDLILSRIFECLESNYITGSNGDKKRRILLTAEAEKAVLAIERSEHQKRARLLCDHIAGMSDDFAVRTFRRLFEQDFGSIVDFV